MKNRINLDKFNVHTDLVIDHDIDKDYVNTVFNQNIKTSTVVVNDKLSKQLKRKCGTYVTIEFVDVTNHEDCLAIESTLQEELHKMLHHFSIQEKDEGLIIGLGNRKSTADSLGPKCIEKIMVTRHLFELNTNVKDDFRSIAAFSPGVMADTGIETYDIILGIVHKIKPHFLIVIDALASSSIDRINCTIQLTDTGIHPGSGVGNHRKELSYDTLGIPVIAIGVPTVVESSIIVNDTINYLFKHLSYMKEHFDTSKLVMFRNLDYREKIKNSCLSKEEKKEVSGILGTLDESDKHALIQEVLQSVHYDLIVTPKEIDFLIDNLCEVISNAINKCLHKALRD